jgi:hypothetical protein
MATRPLDALPLWAVYLLLVLIGFLSVEAGVFLGRRLARRREAQRPQAQDKPKENIDALMGAALSLLAFLLVFMMGIGVNRYDNRRRLVVAEANAVGTTYLRAGYLDEPYRSDVRGLLAEYVDVRLRAAKDPANFDQYRDRSQAILDQLWGQSEALARGHPESEMVGLFITSVNSVIDLHAERAVAVSLRFGASSWLALFAVAFLALAFVGFDLGLSDRRNPLAELVLVLMFSAVLLLIVDVDRPLEGLVQVGQQALIDLQQQIRASGP